MQGRRPGRGDQVFVTVGQACIPDDVAGIGMALEIVKGLHGKENAIYPKKKDIVQILMEAFFHFQDCRACGRTKIPIKSVPA